MNKRLFFSITASALLASTMVQAQDVRYPQTRKDNVVDEYFGEKVADPYRWLENDTSRETAQWVEIGRASCRERVSSPV